VSARRAPLATTLYRIGSITKTFTGAAIMRLRDQGKLGLDDPAVSILPELRSAESPFGPIELATIRGLLTHESGLAGDPPDTDWAGPTYEGRVERNLARVSEIATRIPPHIQHKYSNLGYQLLGEIVARVSGAPFVDYVHRELLEPLGMSATAFEPLPESLLDRCATGYAAPRLTGDLTVAPAPPNVWAEGGLWSCVEDLASWITFQMHEATAPNDVIDPSTLREMHRPRYLGDETWTEAWGIAWYARRVGERIWIQHGGAIGGFRCNVCFDPRQRVGAIALLNGVTADASVLSMDLATIAGEAVGSLPVPPEAPIPMPEAYRPLLGIYLDPGSGWLVRVEWRKGNLTVVDPEDPTWRPILTPTPQPDAFVVDLGVREAGEPAIFKRLPDGRVKSLFVASQTWVRLDRAD
jgi:CubicO group peptidase (beta-lactamase class C family)